MIPIKSQTVSLFDAFEINFPFKSYAIRKTAAIIPFNQDSATLMFCREVSAKQNAANTTLLSSPKKTTPQV